MKIQRAVGISFLITAALFASTGCQMPHRPAGVEAAGSAYQHVFNEAWLFNLADTPGAEAPAFDDAGWRNVNLPHDWSIEQPFDQTLASGTGFLPGGIAWYRKHFTLTSTPYPKVYTLRFDGIYKDSTVYLNGHKLGDRPYGYSSFEYDLTPYLNKAGDNVIAVRVDHHDFADSRWYPGSGIYRNVYLTATNPVHFDRYGICVTTDLAAKAGPTVHLQTTLKNSNMPTGTLLLPTEITLKTVILDPSGKQVASDSQNVSVLQSDTKIFAQDFVIPRPQLWSVDSPAMYTAVTDVICPDGCLFDSYKTPLGIREAKFDPNTGFWLNGVNIKLKGVCLHEDAGGLGSAIPQQVWERRLRILKEAGVNAIRCSHNPPAPEFLDLCDKLGFLVMDEAFDEWNAPTYAGDQGKKKWIDTWSGSKYDLDGYHSDFDKWADTDIKDMVMRDRNHPSIIMWSIGNEIDYPNDPYPPNNEDLVPVARRLIADVKAVDTTRPISGACAGIATNKWYQDLDIIGYNYQEGRYDDDHKAMPNRVIFGSENDMKNLDAWLAVANKPFISAQFLWTGIDYNGEAGRPLPAKTAWPERSRPDGFLDLAGFKKPAFYYRQSLWTDAPMVKIDFNMPQEQADHTLAVPPGLACYTNCQSVEFFQDGKSLGESPLPAATQIIPVPAALSAGPIKAVGKIDGKPVAEDTFTQSGVATRMVLSSYKSLFGPGDGPNVAQIEVSLLDVNDNIARDAANNITVQLDGPGRLLAIESGDVDSHENYQAPQHKAFHGRLLLYIETHGPVNMTTSASGLAEARMVVGK